MQIIPAGVSVLLLLAATYGPAPRFDSWHIVGPGGGGAMFLPTISPHDPNLVLEHCDMTGAYISHDAGRSWRMFNLRHTPWAFAFDPTDPKAIYAGSQALYRSADAGNTWRMIFPDPRRSVEHMIDDHGEGPLTSDDPAYVPNSTIARIAVDPADSRRIYVAFGYRGRGRIWLCGSTDGGATWSRLKDFSGDEILLLYFNHGLRVVSASGVSWTEGASWQHSPAPSAAPIRGAAGGSGLLYATSADGLFLSRDRGVTWRPLSANLTGSPVFGTVACSTLHPESAYVALTSPSDRRYSAIARTADAGVHWSMVYESSGKSAPNVQDAWIENFYGGTGPIRDLGVAPSNPDICYATDSCPRSFRTLDGGKTWQQVISQPLPGNRWATTGFDVTTCYGIHFDPLRPGRQYITYTDVGLWRSDDNGAGWQSSIAGIPRRWQNTTYWVAFDPKVKDLMWGAFARTHDLPRAKMWTRFDPDSFGGGVGTSTDGGLHWTVTNEGMPETAVTHILLDPASPVGARTLYACGFGRGVYKSADNGRTWTLKNAGITEHQPFAWRITRATDGTLYLVIARRSERGDVPGPGDGALYKSTDGAGHWTKMKLPEGVNGPTGLALDGRRIYLSAWGRQFGLTTRDGGIFASDDGGDSWRNIFDRSQHVYDVTIDPVDPNIIYNCGFEVGAWRSTDRGRTWTRLRGFNFKWGHRVIPDPLDRTKIYITTFGGSVWHGPAAGDPRAVEDVVDLPGK